MILQLQSIPGHCNPSLRRTAYIRSCSAGPNPGNGPPGVPSGGFGGRWYGGSLCSKELWRFGGVRYWVQSGYRRTPRRSKARVWRAVGVVLRSAVGTPVAAGWTWFGVRVARSLSNVTRHPVVGWRVRWLAGKATAYNRASPLS